MPVLSITALVVAICIGMSVASVLNVHIAKLPFHSPVQQTSHHDQYFTPPVPQRRKQPDGMETTRTV